MSFFKDFLIDTFNSIVPNSQNHNSKSIIPNPQNNNSSDAMSTTTVAIENHRMTYKLQGYFELATAEIDKALNAETWGLVDDALSHYKKAKFILSEAISTPVSSYMSSSELEKVKFYRQKMSKWKSEVSDRLLTLNQRSGGKSAYKNAPSQRKPAALLPSTSNTNKMPMHKASSPVIRSSITRLPSIKAENSKPVQKSSSSDDSKLVESINSLIVNRSPSVERDDVKWEDIAGLEKAKQALLEMVILPTKRKDLFTGLRRPPKGLLLFGPPGTGKTMLAKAVASEAEATFFNVSASSLTSKWVGEGEKLVRTLFEVAISRQPSVIFIDEIDSIMSARTSTEHDASRRLKSEFLVQFDGVTSSSDDLVIVIGATNKPQELDDAVLRRLVKRIYIPLPDANVRRLLLKHILKGEKFSLPGSDLDRLVRETEGYSGSDLRALCEAAAMIPTRELGSGILTVKENEVRGLRYEDFRKAMTEIRPSLKKTKWEEVEQWNEEFGSN